jgi:hypothetical protein
MLVGVNISSYFVSLACGRIFKEILRSRLSLTWPCSEVLSMRGSYCSNTEQVGLTRAFLSVPITVCVSLVMANECEESFF